MYIYIYIHIYICFVSIFYYACSRVLCQLLLDAFACLYICREKKRHQGASGLKKRDIKEPQALMLVDAFTSVETSRSLRPSRVSVFAHFFFPVLPHTVCLSRHSSANGKASLSKPLSNPLTKPLVKPPPLTKRDSRHTFPHSLRYSPPPIYTKSSVTSSLSSVSICCVLVCVCVCVFVGTINTAFFF
jgi:hypothetical protein